MRLKYKVPLILFVAYFILVGLLITATLFNSASIYKTSQHEAVKATARWHADIVKGFMETKITQLNDLEATVLAINDFDDKAKEAILGKLLYSISDQPTVSDVYVVFERGAFFAEERTKPGFCFNIDVFHPMTGGIEIFYEESYQIADDDDWYNVPKNTSKIHLTEPYKYTYPDETKERVMITLSNPLFVNGKLIGVVGIDMELDKLQKELFDGMKDPKSGAYAIFISNEGLRAAHPKQELLLEPTGNDLEEDEQKKLLEAISKGEELLIIKKSLQTGEVSLMPYVPMKPKGLDLPWSLSYVMPLSALQKEEMSFRSITLVILFVSAILWGVFLVWLMSSIFGNLTRTVSTLKKMTEGNGDLTIRLEEKSKDEIGQMAKGLNSLIEKLHSTIRTTQKETSRLLGTSSALSDIAHKLSKSSEASLEQSASASKATAAASENARTIASEAERASASTSQLTDTAEQMSMNMNSVAGAVEELSSSFAQITDSTDESRQIANEATEKATNATSVMDKLGIAAKEIGQVTDVIKKIADKTNLLALNATIEAASAGEAGKGFAVVAGEIKELANQSAKSADDITRRIEGIQNGTGEAIKVINSVADIISKINASIDSIANSVEQQTKASNEIASNAEQSSNGAKRVVSAITEIANSIKDSAASADNVAHGAKSASESVDSMHSDAKESNANSIELEKTANELKSMAEQLDSIVCKFRT